MDNTANQGQVPQNQGMTTGQEAQQPQAQPQAPVAPTPDESMSNRTKEQFDKLLESNKRLFEANEALRQEMSQRAQAPQPQPQPQPQAVPQQVDARDFIERDPVTGEQYINETKMRARMQEIEERARRAEDRVNKFVQSAEQRETERQHREAFSAYPELEPGSEKFDANFHKQVRGVLTDSMFNPSEYGKVLSFKEAADWLKGISTPANTTAPETESNAGSTESATNASTAKKEQGSAQVQSAPQNAPQQTSSEELMQLREATRLGSDEALAMRLVATEHTRASE